jgi:hypothetical protein
MAVAGRGQLTGCLKAVLGTDSGRRGASPESACRVEYHGPGRGLTRRCYRAGRGAVSGDQVQLPGPRGGLGAVGGAELAQQVGHVLFDRVQRHEKFAGDALV